MSAPLLAIEGLRKRFGGLTVLTGVTTSVAAGEVRAIIGPNGAGKTTFINTITGVHRADAGRVMLAGRDMARAAPYVIARAGMARTWQIASLYPALTVAENVTVACAAARAFSHARLPSSWQLQEAVAESLDLVGLARLGNRPVAEISHGDQRLLEIAVTTALRPAVILLDEPTAGMSPSETQGFIALVNNRLREHCTIVLVEHDMQVVMQTADSITVLAGGRVLAEGTPASIRADAAVQEAYLGNAYAH